MLPRSCSGCFPSYLRLQNRLICRRCPMHPNVFCQVMRGSSKAVAVAAVPALPTVSAGRTTGLLPSRIVMGVRGNIWRPDRPRRPRRIPKHQRWVIIDGLCLSAEEGAQSERNASFSQVCPGSSTYRQSDNFATSKCHFRDHRLTIPFSPLL